MCCRFVNSNSVLCSHYRTWRVLSVGYVVYSIYGFSKMQVSPKNRAVERRIQCTTFSVSYITCLEREAV